MWRRSTKRLKRLGEKKQVKSIIFIPHTRDSKLAMLLRDRKGKLEETSGDRVKIIEKAGRKIEEIFTNKDPWKSKDCLRPNCFICMTKKLTGKDLNKDCTKRNINYVIKCLTCEADEKKKIEKESGDDIEMKRKLEERMQVPIYVGETSRSGYERGFEHLDNMAKLSSRRKE